MADSVQVVTAHYVTVDISSTLTSFVSNKRFQKDLTIAALKGKLELVSGVPTAGMKLELYNPDGQLICVMDNDTALLGSYHVDDGCRIHVIDTVGSSVGQFDDVSKVEKYEMTQEDYDKRTDSVKAFKERMKMGRFDPELQKQKEEEKQKKAEEEQKKIEGMKAGDRCEVRVPGQPTRRGTVQYTGIVQHKWSSHTKRTRKRRHFVGLLYSFYTE